MPSLEAKYVENNMRHILLGLIVVAAAATQAKATQIITWAGNDGPGSQIGLLPDMAGQEIPFFVRTELEGIPGELTLDEMRINSTVFYVAIGNGGTDMNDLVNGALAPDTLDIQNGPKITGISIEGSIWEGSGVPTTITTRFPAAHGGNSARNNYPVQFIELGFETDPTNPNDPPVHIPADGLLFTMIVDTRGFGNDTDVTWSLEYDDWLANDGLPGFFRSKFDVRGRTLPDSTFVSNGQQAVIIPEPSSWILASLGVALAAFVGWRRRRRTT